MPEEERLDDEPRREFLRKSAYAAYATPVILAMLAEKAGACKSWNTDGSSYFTFFQR